MATRHHFTENASQLRRVERRGGVFEQAVRDGGEDGEDGRRVDATLQEFRDILGERGREKIPPERR